MNSADDTTPEFFVKDGAVGIGTTEPAGTLDVRGGRASTGDGSSINIYAQNGSSDGNSDGGDIILMPGDKYGTGVTGRVGIGTTAPNYKLEVAGNMNAQGNLRAGGDLEIYGGPNSAKLNFWGAGSIRGGSDTFTNAMRFISGRSGTGNTNIFTWHKGNDASGNALMILKANGDLKIEGGFVAGDGSRYDDVAEIISVSDATIEPGDVVVVDPANDKSVIKSQNSYQTSVLGVISEKGGILLGGDSDTFKKPIALVGRVPVKISVENGAIKRGDPLTSSSLPGHAMKLTKPGRIIGFAMENFDGSQWETGKIITFINLSWFDPTVIK